MRIGFLTRLLDTTVGGAHGSLNLMATALAERSHDVSVITFNPSRNNIAHDLPYPVVCPHEKHVKTRVGVNYRTFQLLNEYEEEFDLFHIFRPVTLPGAGIYRAQGGITPVVGRLNSYTMFCTNKNRMRGECYKNCTTYAKFSHSPRSIPKKIGKIPLYFSRSVLEPRYVNHVDRFIAISPPVKDVYTSIGVDGQSISVIPNFYDPDFATETTDTVTKSREETLNVLFAGRVIGLKDLTTVLNALDSISVPVELDIVGDGDELQNLKNRVKELELEERVTFHGWIEHKELPQYFRAADLTVHPTRLPEPFGRSVLESLQCGTPVLVANTGAPPWIVGDAGRTFEPENPDDLARELSDLARSSQKLNRLRSNCQMELRRFELGSCINDVETEYKRLVTDDM